MVKDVNASAEPDSVGVELRGGDSTDDLSAVVPAAEKGSLAAQWEDATGIPAALLPIEALCGITVALAQVPEAVAFSFVAGVDPFVGLTAAWIMGIMTAVFGGRPAMISGATGAIAAVTGTMVEEHGVEYLLYAVMLMGCLQLAMAALKCGGLVRLIPHPVMMGFCNGLAIVIGASQFASYKHADYGGDDDDHRRLSGALGVFDTGGWIDGGEAWWAAFITIAAFASCFVFPMLTKKFPPSLAAIIVATLVEHALARPLGFKTQTVADFASVKGTLPIPVWFDDKRYEMPPLNMETLQIVFPLAVVMALIGLIESLMTLNLVDELTSTKGDGNRECFGQGLANLVCGALGGMGGCAMIGQSMINVKSGGTTRLSGVGAGLFLLIILLALYPLINTIPVAGLAGVMFNVVYHTFEWPSLRIVFFTMLPMSARDKLGAHFGDRKEYKIRRTDAFTIILVTGVTLLADLAVAVIAGVLFSALMFAWEQGTAITAVSALVPAEAEGGEDGAVMRVYDVTGPLFFGSVTPFLEFFDAQNDPETVVVRFERSTICDFSALTALNTLVERYERVSKTIKFERIVDVQSRRMLEKAKLLSVEAVHLELDSVPFDPASGTGGAAALNVVHG